MAKPTLELIAALRATATRLEGGVRYQWTHMGHCNCGHVAQTLTNLSGQSIHDSATESPGDWSEQMRDYCPDTNLPIDRVVDTMVGAGMTTVDIGNLERLSCPVVLREIPDAAKPLRYKTREDVVLYLRTWANILEAQWRSSYTTKTATETV